jgi:hypothetical protein
LALRRRRSRSSESSVSSGFSVVADIGRGTLPQRPPVPAAGAEPPSPRAPLAMFGNRE